jgi:hypothetical protein
MRRAMGVAMMAKSKAVMPMSKNCVMMQYFWQ